ncbi:EthD domain-containing protein [Hypoxylon rubiginosum]|uniref:EthD domain-containing protein n=1 Tax=Hypoxylon rubiginosum TaxID=110542 RepID=A0ACC0D7S4_9PEZI|nr:EthD domain-containing protein [Hypoxylon rubiginosum]
MPHTILFFVSRKQGISMEEFKTQYENDLLPLLKEVAGPHFPLEHTRRYIKRTEGQGKEATPRNPDTPAQVLVGAQADFDYDAIIELKFASEAAFGQFFQFVHTPEKAARVTAVEDRFMDRSQMRGVVLGDVVATKNE